MSKLRSVSTSIWSDPFIEDCSVSEKLLFIYLLTNEKTNMLGIYEASVKKIAFETGINKADIEKALKRFQSIGKVRYTENYVVLVNFLKHQSFNTNMKKSAIDVYITLPEHLQIEGFTPDRNNPLESFERLSKALGMVPKYEVEDEGESEEEKEEKRERERIAALFDNYIDEWKKATGRTIKSKKTEIAKEALSHFNARIREGYTLEEITSAINNAASDSHHSESGYKWLTLDFILRPKQLERWRDDNREKIKEDQMISQVAALVEQKERERKNQMNKQI